MVYVLSKTKKPLIPCSNVIARLLLKKNRVKVKHLTPFTIQLTYVTETEYVQVLAHGVDIGSSKLGSAVVDENGNVLYQAEVEI
jgi:activator of 2-hydroxyglutaryl-CoA dehydratase